MKTIELHQIFQVFENRKLGHIPSHIIEEFEKIKLCDTIKPGMKIGITAGSRGINNIPLIIKTVIQQVKKYEGIPVIIAAMGSHGGATVEGQLSVLASYGITPDTMEVPVLATTDVIKLGQLPNGLPVYTNKIVSSLDGLIIVNRIKPHTSFKSNIESGLCKMLAVGLGNHKGASLVHSLGVKGLSEYMVKFAEIILREIPVLCGLGILENGYDKTYKITAVNPKDFKKLDCQFLKESKKLLPRLPVKDIDLLIVKEIGKNFSGTGLDTNIVGGIPEASKSNFQPPSIKEILLLNLSEESHGNAHGVGLATAITRRLYEKIDFNATYTNSITSGFLYKSRIPMIFDTEEKAIHACLAVLGKLPGTLPRIIIIKNTLELDKMFVSEPIWNDIKYLQNITSSSFCEELKFDNDGKLFMKV